MGTLDNRLMAFNTRHADVEMPRYRFSSGASTVAMFQADEFFPLLIQITIVLDCCIRVLDVRL